MTEETTPVQLSLGDIIGAVQIIDICSKRGAFEGQELAQVGALRDRLAQFAQANRPDEEPEEEAEEGEAEAE